MTALSSSHPYLESGPIIGRVRLHAVRPVDATPARLRLESVLGQLSFETTGLPKSAVLCIRRLRDPIPHTLPLAWGGRPSQAWQQALLAEIGSALRGAARPAEMEVPATQAAVLFRDRAELLACLALDWMQGSLEARWWWRHLLRSRSSRLAPVQWLAEAAYVPSAASQLAKRDALIPFVASLEGEEVRLLVASLCAIFGLERALPDAVQREPVPGESSLSRAEATEAGWLQWVPEVSDPRIASAQSRAWVALSLGLARVPGLARRPEMLALLGRWMAHEQTPAPEGGTRTGQARFEQPSRGSRVAATGPRLQEPEVRPADGSLPPSLTPRADPLAAGTPAARERASAPSATAPDLGSRLDAFPDQTPRLASEPLSMSQLASVPDLPALAHGAPPLSSEDDYAAVPPGQPSATRNEQHARGQASTSALPAAPLRRPPPVPQEISIVTAYGGVFFLLNALLALELYGDFTRPQHRVLGPSPWTLLQHIARVLLGNAADAQDPLWELLQKLAGPVSESEPWPNEFRVAQPWLLPFPERHWLWQTQSDRFQLMHPLGFVVLDALLESDPAAQSQRECRAYGVEATPAPLTSEVPSSWPQLLALFLRARIHSALGAENPAGSVQLALELRARAFTTDTHVEVHMALAELPLELRMAGLDRDPGWIPAAGRFVTFHFESPQ